jgi:hypothetical protein
MDLDQQGQEIVVVEFLQEQMELDQMVQFLQLVVLELVEELQLLLQEVVQCLLGKVEQDLHF